MSGLEEMLKNHCGYGALILILPLLSRCRPDVWRLWMSEEAAVVEPEVSHHEIVGRSLLGGYIYSYIADICTILCTF